MAHHSHHHASSSSSSSSAAHPQPQPPRTPYHVLQQTFLIDSAYSISKELGQGAYGCVAAATHNATGESVAIKKITNVFSKRILTKRALREIKLLRHFRGHKNITCLYDMDIIDPYHFNVRAGRRKEEDDDGEQGRRS